MSYVVHQLLDSDQVSPMARRFIRFNYRLLRMLGADRMTARLIVESLLEVEFIR